jgi:hypothetical protein
VPSRPAPRTVPGGLRSGDLTSAMALRFDSVTLTIDDG